MSKNYFQTDQLLKGISYLLDKLYLNKIKQTVLKKNISKICFELSSCLTLKVYSDCQSKVRLEEIKFL